MLSSGSGCPVREPSTFPLLVFPPPPLVLMCGGWVLGPSLAWPLASAFSSGCCILPRPTLNSSSGWWGLQPSPAQPAPCPSCNVYWYVLCPSLAQPTLCSGACVCQQVLWFGLAWFAPNLCQMHASGCLSLTWAAPYCGSFIHLQGLCSNRLVSKYFHFISMCLDSTVILKCVLTCKL